MGACIENANRSFSPNDNYTDRYDVKKKQKRLQRRIKTPKAAQVIHTLRAPVTDFMNLESSGGLVLIFISIAAMIWANSPLGDVYEHFIHTPINLSIGSLELNGSFQHWVNDGLMAIFFYVVGLEIKRELLVGELSSVRKAALPMLAAIGGMVLPALFYLGFNIDGPASRGWGIPMATDIAFALGILTMMSRKAPFAAKIFLLALAIVDDLGAVLVIAFFYTNEIIGSAIGIAVASFLLIIILRASGIRAKWLYLILSLIAWYGVLKSGVHATIAGVILGFLTPIKSFYNERELVDKFISLTDKLKKDVDTTDDNSEALSLDTEHSLSEIAYYSVGGQSPVEKGIHNWHPWVTFAIMPLFALVNAGVKIDGIGFQALTENSVALGIIFGLCLGKPLGVLITCFIAVKLKLAELPKGISWFQMTIIGVLAGVGFTMALFVSNLALGAGSELEMFSKLGILLASAFSGILGFTLLAFSKDCKEPK